MTKREKLEEKIRENQRNVSLEDFEALIRCYGYIKEGTKHPKAMIGHLAIPYKRTNPVGKPFVKIILGIIDNLDK